MNNYCPNLKKIVEEVDGLIGKKFKDSHSQKVYRFFGVVIGDDDYYYGMARVTDTEQSGKLRLLSCVGNLETHGYELIEE